MKADANRWPSKLSKEFVARLASIPGHETLHAVVLLETSERCSASQRHTLVVREERRSATLTVVEAPGVIKILANLKDVKTVLEDQNVSMLP